MDTRKLCLDCGTTRAEYICRSCLKCEVCCKCADKPQGWSHRLTIEGSLLRERRHRKAAQPA